MKMRTILLAACLSATASLLFHAENAHAETCAWLNAATASGLLDTNASVKIEPITEHLTRAQSNARLISGARPDATCTFLPQQETSGAKLEIAVHTMADIATEFPTYTATCGKDSLSLRAVGNQAIECTISDDKHNRIEKVVARTRDRAFLLSWTIPGSNSGADAMTQDVVREKMRNLAEQVAGSLF